MPLYGVYDFTDRYGTGRADMEPFLARVVFKSRLDDDRPRWEQASSITHVGPDAPPFFVIHGTNDSLVPVEQARTFVDQLRAQSRQPVAYAEIPGAQHAFESFPSVRAMATVHAIERFLAYVRSEHAARSVALGSPAAPPRRADRAGFASALIGVREGRAARPGAPAQLAPGFAFNPSKRPAGRTER